MAALGCSPSCVPDRSSGFKIDYGLGQQSRESGLSIFPHAQPDRNLFLCNANPAGSPMPMSNSISGHPVPCFDGRAFGGGGGSSRDAKLPVDSQVGEPPSSHGDRRCDGAELVMVV